MSIVHSLLQLANNAKLSKYVQPLELPKKEKKIPANLDCLVVGWGKTGRHECVSSVLKEATENTQFKVECDKIWKEIFTSQQMICTKFTKNKGGICQVNGSETLHTVSQDAGKTFKTGINVPVFLKFIVTLEEFNSGIFFFF